LDRRLEHSISSKGEDGIEIIYIGEYGKDVKMSNTSLYVHFIVAGGFVNNLTAKESRPFTGSISANQEVTDPFMPFTRRAIASLPRRMSVERTVQMATASNPRSGRPIRTLPVKKIILGFRRAVMSRK
jgi:hypothetical protein